MSQPKTYYRLWCGRKRYSHWLPDMRGIVGLAVRHGLAFENADTVNLGPLTWVERGTRARSKARTVSQGRCGLAG